MNKLRIWFQGKPWTAEEKQEWEKRREKGFRHFVFLRLAPRWCLAMTILMLLSDYFVGHSFAFESLLVKGGIAYIAGVFQGAFVWFENEKKASQL